jgi:diacylglycerol kinase family enzyme
VAKQPYYGYGVKVVPGACFDDGQLHILKIRSRLLGCLWGLATSLTLGNRVGQQETGGSVKVALDRPVFSQMDGNIGWERDRFRFDILAGALKIKGV